MLIKKSFIHPTLGTFKSSVLIEFLQITFIQCEEDQSCFLCYFIVLSVCKSRRTSEELNQKKVEHSNIENTFHNLLASVNNLPPEVQQCQAELLRNYSKMKLLYINSVLQLQQDDFYLFVSPIVQKQTVIKLTQSDSVRSNVSANPLHDSLIVFINPRLSK